MHSIVVTLSVLIILFNPGSATMSTGVTFFDAHGHELYNHPSDGGCSNLPDFVAYNNESYITTDACIIVFPFFNCVTSWDSIIVRPDDHIVNAKDLLLNCRPNSFKPCNSTDGSQQINVDFFSEYKQTEWPIIAQIRDLCSCQNIPSNAAMINNHGNCVLLFENADCHGAYQINRAGLSDKSFFQKNLFHSVSPCVEPPHCLKKNAIITNLKISDSTNKTLLRKASIQSVVMSSTTTFLNLGNAHVMHEYSAKKTFQETVRTTLLQSLSSMHSVGISETVSFEWKFGNPFIDQTKIAASISAGYNYTHKFTNTEKKSHVSTEAKQFSVNQRILVPPCTSYQITSFLKYQEKMPIEYTIYAQISATLGVDRMNASDIRNRLTDMIWVQDVDKFTILAKGTSYAVADFGIETYVKGSTLPITQENCVPSTDTNLNGDKVFFAV